MSAILLLHGFATDCNDFNKIAPLLSARYQEVCCPNLPYHGEGTEKEKMCHKDILDFVEAAFDQLKKRHKQVDVLGFSMGGALASHLASNKDVHRLILLAPANKYLSLNFLKNSIKWFIEASHIEKSRKTGKEVQSETTVSVKEMMGDISDGLKRFFTRIIKRYTFANISEFSKVIKYCNTNLKDIHAPTIIIWGKLDQLVPYSSIRHVVRHCRNDITRIIVYPDVSHLMLYSSAHYKITDDILRFLEDTQPLKLT